MNKDDCVLCSVVDFDDGSSAARVLFRGTEAACAELRDAIPAVAWNTDKPITNSYCCIMAVIAEDLEN